MASNSLTVNEQIIAEIDAFFGTDSNAIDSSMMNLNLNDDNNNEISIVDDDVDIHKEICDAWKKKPYFFIKKLLYRENYEFTRHRVNKNSKNYVCKTKHCKASLTIMNDGGTL